MLLILLFFGVAMALPVVDKGVFVITGVKTCGLEGMGYCILGGDCTVDKEFVNDENNGHCDGLRKAFTPRAFFVCCQLKQENTTTTTTTIATTTIETEIDSAESISKSSEEEKDEDSVEMTTIKKDDVTENILDVQTEITVVREISSCSNNRFDAVKMASQSTNTPQICWTGAITRTHSPLYSDPGSFLCTGALISPTLLLTTATCVSRLFGQDLNQYKVVLGSRHLLHPMNGRTPNSYYRDVKELVIHEEYGVKGGFVRINDIAVVKLSEPSPEESVCTVCLPTSPSDNSGEECVVSGYSHPTTNTNSVVVESDGILHEAVQQIESQENCDVVIANYSNNNPNLFRGDFDSGLICASGKKDAEACFSPRDAGSPLACPFTDGYKLVGLFSSGFHCGSVAMPVLYTEVGHHWKWINKFLSK